MTLVANATGFSADAAGFHAPPARIPEIADLFAERPQGGLMGGRAGSTSSTICAWRRRRASPAASSSWCAARMTRPGRCSPARAMSSAARARRMLYLPRHLLGVEAATSMLDAAGLGRSGYGDDYRPRQDLVAVAQRDLVAGTVLTMGGHHHSIDGVGAQVRPAAALAADRPAPFYLDRRPQAGARREGGRSDRARRCRNRSGDSGLLAMRKRQDALFAADGPASFDSFGSCMP
jgi:predicted homoserine dehydrogenase-like protein